LATMTSYCNCVCSQPWCIIWILQESRLKEGMNEGTMGCW